jgi:hypothetical protein
VNELNTLTTGSGDLILDGSANDHNFMTSGSGNLRAYDLSTENTNVRTTGSGNAEVDVSGKLDIISSGSGSVYYTGNPSLTQSISGSGRVVKR